MIKQIGERRGNRRKVGKWEGRRGVGRKERQRVVRIWAWVGKWGGK